MAVEQWKPIRGWEGCYEISDQGRVRNSRTGLVRKSALSSNGYLAVTLKGAGRAQQTITIHRHLLIAFRGIQEGMDACHIDEDKGNNTLANLRWGTRAENIGQYARSGRYRNQNTDKTHCPSGHEYNAENTRLKATRNRPNPQRVCIICARNYAKRSSSAVSNSD